VARGDGRMRRLLHRQIPGCCAADFRDADQATLLFEPASKVVRPGDPP
jgi:hypothetical protein